MKRSKTLVPITLIIIALLMGCETPETTIPTNPVTPYSQISFSTTVDFWNPKINYNQINVEKIPRTELLATGVSSAKFLYEFELMLSHLVVENPMDNTLQFLEGVFEVNAEGCSIYGSYTGSNVTPGEQSPVGLVMKIEGGSGFFEGAKGHLNGWWTPYIEAANAYTLEIKGTIITYPDPDPGNRHPDIIS